MSAKGPRTGDMHGTDVKSSNHSVVYSFFHKWEVPLRAGRVHLFFRKRYPIQKPSRVYFYVGSPLMAIIGSASVVGVARLPKDEALLLADDGCISVRELSNYIGDSQAVGVIRIDDFEFFENPIPAYKVAAEIGLSPPQNFQKISAEEEAAIRGLINGA